MKKILCLILCISSYIVGMQTQDEAKKHFREFHENGKTSFSIPDYYYLSRDRTWALNATKKIILNHRTHITNPEEIKKIEQALEQSTYELLADQNSKSGAQKVLNLSPLHEQFHRNLPFIKRHPVMALGMTAMGAVVVAGTATYGYIFGNLFRRT